MARYKTSTGHTYQTKERRSFYELGKGYPTLIEIYKCEHFLSKKQKYFKLELPKGEKEKIMNSVKMTYNENLNLFVAHHDSVFNYFKKKYPKRLKEENITTYNELVYRSQNKR